LAVLGVLLVGWIGIRAAQWERIELPALAAPFQVAVARVLPADAPELPVQSLEVRDIVPLPPVAVRPLDPPVPVLPPRASGLRQPASLPEFGQASGPFGPSRVAAAHQLAWMAGVAQLPIPRFIIDRLGHGDPAAGLIPAEALQVPQSAMSASRWSAAGWLLLRDGGVGLTGAGLPSPSYGASQLGAVLRYRLIPASKHRPAVFLRGTSAVRSPRGEEVALGLSARPFAGVPITLQAELRATRQLSATTLRPALGAVTELPQLTLPGGFAAEAYGQAGYVGDADGTAFVDAQLRVERRLAHLSRGALHLGFGVWGGAQEGARRIDLGPTARLDFPIGKGQGRVSADWRLRAAGNAAPRSGPALILSAGF
jgi:hypothetical protein